jgi:hypothetical protein
MNRPGILIAALITVALGVANILLGRGLITPLALAQERGAEVPWYLVWTMIMLTVLCAVTLGVFLVGSLRNSNRR